MGVLPYDVLAFIFDTIEDSVLIADFTKNVEIEFKVNSPFERMMGVQQKQISYGRFPFFSEETQKTFTRTLIECREGGSRCRKLFLMYEKGQRITDIQFNVESIIRLPTVCVSFYPCFQTDLCQYITCTFKSSDASRMERLEELETFESYSGIQAGIYEYDEKKDDALYIYGSKPFEVSTGWNGSKRGKYMKKDLHFDKTEGFIEASKKIGTNTSQVETIENDEISVRFLEIGTSGLPRYFHSNNAENRLKKRLAQVEHECSILKKIFEESPAFMGVVQALSEVEGGPYVNTVHTFANPASQKAFGVQIGNASDCKSLNKSWSNHFKEARETKKPIVFEESFPHMSMSVIVNHLQGDEYTYVAQDITQKQMLEDRLRENQEKLESTVKARTLQLEQALQVKSRFLAIMSHEMRTPLSGITTMTVLLSEAPNLLPEQKEMLNIARVCSDQLLVAVTDILDLTQMEESRLSLEESPFMFQEIMEEALDVVSFEADRKGIELVSNPSSELTHIVVKGDSRRLRQIFINLMANSVKFSHSGEILVSAKIKNELSNGKKEILCSVQDNGMGIPESSKEHLFQPFYQADSTSTRRHGGSGLGLSISKRLAEMMGGTMWFESEEGKGTTFYFTAIFDTSLLPRENMQIEVLPTSFRVLQVHSNPKGAAVMSERISELLHVSPTLITDYNQALHTIDAADFDLVILNLNEKQFLEYSIGLKIINLKQRPPLIALCAEELARKSKEAFENISVVKKPIKLKKLQTAFHSLFPDRVTSPVPISPSLSTDDIMLPLIKRTMRQNTDVQAILNSSQNSISNLLVLVAEDNVLNQRIIKRILDSIGLPKLEFVEDGEKAVEACTKKKYDLVLMDIMMPKMNGIEAVQMIRQTVAKEYQPRYIMALTANALLENKEKCLAAGMSYVLTKPLEKEVLLREVHRLFNL